MSLLEIRGLRVNAGGQPILKGLDLSVDLGEVHAIMGPNGSGKSTLANVLAGREDFEVTAGDMVYRGESILDSEPEERARKGIFMAFQFPVEIPGLTNMELLKTAVDALRESRGQQKISAADFLKRARSAAESLGLDPQFLRRGVNEGFSGGERKRNEILQLAVIEPTLAVLDETDSGLDIDSVQLVAKCVDAFQSESTAVILVTHHERLLNHVVPDFVHVLSDGRIASSGGPELAGELEERGFGWLESA